MTATLTAYITEKKKLHNMKKIEASETPCTH